MKRFHVHVSVANLHQSIAFYSHLFGAAPNVEKVDYAKWMLDEPRINFAISRGENKPGLNHLGFQVDTEEELTELNQQVEAAGLSVVNQGAAFCCYASSDKYWLQDPQGVAWETFRTLAATPIFSPTTADSGKDTNLRAVCNNVGCCPANETN